MISYFSKFGFIEDGYLIYDKNSTNSRCFGFIEFKTREIAEFVNNMKHFVDGKEIVTKFQVLKNRRGSRDEETESVPALCSPDLCYPQHQSATLSSENYQMYNQCQAVPMYGSQSCAQMYQSPCDANGYQYPTGEVYDYYGSNGQYFDQNVNNGGNMYYDQNVSSFLLTFLVSNARDSRAADLSIPRILRRKRLWIHQL